MKKIISILIVALVALAFMGCPTTFADRSFLAQVGDIIGDMNGDGIEVTTVGTVSSVSFTYANDMIAWGGGDGVCNFKIRKIAGEWSGDYGFAAVSIGSLPTGVTAADKGGNIMLSGLVDGTKYTISVELTDVPITVSVSAN